jgi:hypothetical protein
VIAFAKDDFAAVYMNSVCVYCLKYQVRYVSEYSDLGLFLFQQCCR